MSRVCHGKTLSRYVMFVTTKNTRPMNMMMIGHFGWFILALLYCSYFETSNFTKLSQRWQNKYLWNIDVTCTALYCRSKLPSSVSELSVSFNVVLSCSSRSASCNVIREADAMMEPGTCLCSLAGRARPAGPRRQELYPPNLWQRITSFLFIAFERGSTTLHVNIWH